MAVNASRATGYKVTAGDWNDLAALANSVESVTNNVTTGNTALGGRVTTLETRTTGLGTDSNTTTGTASAQLTAVRSRLTTLETATTGLGSGSNVVTGTASAQLTDLRSRAAALETITSSGTTGNAALGSRVTTLEAGATAPPTCILIRSTNFVATAGADTILPWDSAEQNDSVGGNAMWASGDSTKITIRQAGVYDIGCLWHSATNPTGVALASITKNSTTQSNTATLAYDQKQLVSTFAGGMTLRPGCLVRLAAGDILRVLFYVEVGQTLSNTSFSGQSRFWATYIRS